MDKSLYTFLDKETINFYFISRINIFWVLLVMVLRVLRVLRVLLVLVLWVLLDNTINNNNK